MEVDDDMEDDMIYYPFTTSIISWKERSAIIHVEFLDPLMPSRGGEDD